MKQCIKSKWFKYVVSIAGILGAILISGIILIKKTTPLYTLESLNSSAPINTLPLNPTDSITGTFQVTSDYLEEIKIAFSFDEDISTNTIANVLILHEDEVIIEQPLEIAALPNRTFITFFLGRKCKVGDNFTVKIENISAGNSNEKVSFSLLATDKEYLYLPNTQNYRFNQQEQEARLLYNFNYITGYSYYEGLTYVFWIYLLVLSVVCICKQKRFF